MAAMLRDSTVVVAVVVVVAHDNHEKINSWVSFSLYGYGAPLGPQELRYQYPIFGPTKKVFRATGITLKIFFHDFPQLDYHALVEFY